MDIGTHGESIDQVYLLGSMARWPRVEKLLESLIAIPVRVVDLRSVFPVRSDNATSPELELGDGATLAAGLALRNALNG